MIIGIPKENKLNEYRVAATPASVSTLINSGHKVYVEHDAGIGSGFDNAAYVSAGAQLIDKKELYAKSDMLYKVKEIDASEFDMLREDLIVFTYLHSNAHNDMTLELLKKKVIGIAYEDVEDEQGEFPLLSPMSILAGKGGFLAALNFAQSVHGGNGLLLSQVTGVPTPSVTIIGCGWSGVGAAELASAFGNKVSMLDVSLKAMEKARLKLPVNVELLYSTRENLVSCLKTADVIINCILWNKTRKDHLISREDLKLMKPGAMIIDVACDDGGAVETCRSTTHADPIYFEEGILHYAVDNIPSGFSHTASQMLSAVTLPYALNIANRGIKTALLEDAKLRKGLTCFGGYLTLKETALKQNIPFTDAVEAINKHSSQT